MCTKSTNFGEPWGRRELLIFTHTHNCATDIARGICRRDLYGVRFWAEQEALWLWTKI